MRDWRLALGVILGVTVTGCSTATRNSTSRSSAHTYSEATMFLGTNGQIVTRESTRAKVRAAEAAAYWRGDGVTGAPSITIDLGAQKAYFYKGGQLVGESPISSGNARNPTPHGSFRVIQKHKDHRSNLYGAYVDEVGNLVVENVDSSHDMPPPGTKFLGARMPYFMRFSDGVGLHAGYLPGFPDSHGCVRLPDRMARLYFENASCGTPIRVIN